MEFRRVLSASERDLGHVEGTGDHRGEDLGVLEEHELHPRHDEGDEKEADPDDVENHACASRLDGLLEQVDEHGHVHAAHFVRGDEPEFVGDNRKPLLGAPRAERAGRRVADVGHQG